METCEHVMAGFTKEGFMLKLHVTFTFPLCWKKLVFHVIFFFGERFFLEDLFNILAISTLRPDRLIFARHFFFFFTLSDFLGFPRVLRVNNTRSSSSRQSVSEKGGIPHSNFYPFSHSRRSPH